jgi:putative flippase GtrA
MKLVRYFFVGGSAAVVDISIFSIAIKIFHLDWFYVALISFIIATAVNYVLSIRYVFESGIRFERHAEISLVYMVSSVGLVLNQLVLWHLIETAGLDEVLSKLIATSVVFVWNYNARSRFVFRNR